MGKRNRFKHYRNMDQDKKSYADEQPVDETVNPAENAGESQVDEQTEQPEETNELEAFKTQLAETQEALEKEKKEYLFLMAEFDNFRKRTLREKSEILRNGAESAMKGLLPIVDDFERGLDAIKDTDNAEAVKEGMVLIYNKFIKYLEQNGVKAMESTGADFNDELHEAVALVPGAPEQKNKVIDTLQKGYMLNDKVLRHAKVAVGQ